MAQDGVQRVCVTGAPKSGKTTFALGNELLTGVPTFHTDDLGGEWSAVSRRAASWLEQDGPWLIEGVRVPHALRKWLLAHPEGKPCDVLIVLDDRDGMSDKQRAMGVGIATILAEILPELKRRGVEVRHGQ